MGQTDVSSQNQQAHRALVTAAVTVGTVGAAATLTRMLIDPQGFRDALLGHWCSIVTCFAAKPKRKRKKSENFVGLPTHPSGLGLVDIVGEQSRVQRLSQQGASRQDGRRGSKDSRPPVSRRLQKVMNPAVSPPLSPRTYRQGRVVFVIVGATPDKSFPTFALSRLRRYLRWSGIENKLFAVFQPGPEHEDSSCQGGNRCGNNGNKRECHCRPHEGIEARGRQNAVRTIAIQGAARRAAKWAQEQQGGAAAIFEAGISWGRLATDRHAFCRAIRAESGGAETPVIWVEAWSPPRSPGTDYGSDLLGVTTPSASTNGYTSGGGRASPPRQGGQSSVSLASDAAALQKRGSWSDRDDFEPLDIPGDMNCVRLQRGGEEVQMELRGLKERSPLALRAAKFVGCLRAAKMGIDSAAGYPIYLTRHGESVYNVTGQIGGDPKLSERGEGYAGVLADFMVQEPEAGQSILRVWCSPLKRATQTARAVKCLRYRELEALREINPGQRSGYTYEQLAEQFPEEVEERSSKKLEYRYPGGESYMDVIARLDPIVRALEKEEGPVLVIAHQAVLRCLYGYYLGVKLENLPYLPIPLHVVIRMAPNRLAGWSEQSYRLMRSRLEKVFKTPPSVGEKVRATAQTLVPSATGLTNIIRRGPPTP